MPNDMITKAAKAACLHSYRSMMPRIEADLLAAYVEDNWRAYVGQVRAVIEAMRYPTPSMIAAVAGYGREDDHPDIWRTMIDAALRE